MKTTPCSFSTSFDLLDKARAQADQLSMSWSEYIRACIRASLDRDKRAEARAKKGTKP